MTWRDRQMVRRTRIWASFMLVGLLLLPGCGGDDGLSDREAERAVEADNGVVGSFVGEVAGTEAFVAVVAAPALGGDAGAVQIYVSDGAGVSEWFSGQISDSSFVATSDDGDAETEGTLSSDSVTGTVELPDGETVEYEASPPSGAAGLYELTVSSGGELSGASAAGLGVTGEISLGRRGSGTLQLVDGERLEFAVTPDGPEELTHLSAGQVRLIVLPSGELRGAGKGRPTADDGSDFFIRSG
jgi:hypothetical protein